jgi:hypothetical protein
MIRRWGLAAVVWRLAVVVMVGAALFSTNAAGRPYADHVLVSQGPSVPAPAPRLPRSVDTTAQFTVQAVVASDRSVQITENIVQVFAEPRRGILRSVPLSTNQGETPMRSLEIATSPGAPGTVQLTDLSGGVQVRVGEPNTTITGTHAYRLSYVLEDVVDATAGEAVVRLDAVTEWEHDIDMVEYRVGGVGIPNRVACFAGPFGTTSPCDRAEITNGEAVFQHANLPAGHGVTVEVWFPSDRVAATATTTPPRRSSTAPMVAVAVMVAGLMAAWGVTHRRAHRSIARASVAGALAPYGPAPLEFVPPLDLDPASMLRLRDGMTTDIPTALAATLVDLAAGGVIDLIAVGDDWEVVRRATSRQLTTYEQLLMDSVLVNGDRGRLGDARDALAGVIGSFVARVDDQLREQRLRDERRVAVVGGGRSTRWIGPLVTAIAALVGVALATGSTLPSGPSGALVIAVGGAMAVVWLVQGAVRDRMRVRGLTEDGRGAVRRIQGFERFFRESEAMHAQAAVRLGLVRDYLGYAVAFGAVREWVEAMPDQVAQAATHGVDVAAWGALATAPVWRDVSRRHATTSSGSSGFGSGSTASGSSSSGGGRGGGGGGSW